MSRGLFFYVILRGMNSRGHENLSPKTVLLFCLAAAGLFLVSLSENGTLGKISIHGSVFGMAGALLAAVAMERSIKWGEKAESQISADADMFRVSERKPKTYREIRIVTVFTLAATILMNLAASAVSFAGVFMFRWLRREPVFAAANFFYTDFVWVFLISIALGSAALIGFRKGGLEARDDKIFAISYFMPIMAVCWLWAHSLYTQGSIQLARPDYFAAGVLAVVAANLGLNFSRRPQRAEHSSP